MEIYAIPKEVVPERERVREATLKISRLAGDYVFEIKEDEKDWIVVGHLQDDVAKELKSKYPNWAFRIAREIIAENIADEFERLLSH